MTQSEIGQAVIPFANRGSPVAVTGQRIRPPLGDPDLGEIQPEFASKLIRRIFVAGLHLAALQSLLDHGPLSYKAAAIVEELDTVIQDIRAAI